MSVNATLISSSSYSTSISTPTSSSSTSSLSTTIERNKALVLCLVFLVPVVVFVAIVLCYKFSCGRQRAKTLEKERLEDEKLDREAEEALRSEGIITTDDEWT
ncbi:hypothetical protein JCM3766R1_006813, partial [Sporobolomyces carnicolor]